MHCIISVVALILFYAPATAADDLSWAYPVTPRADAPDNLVLKQVPDSTKAYTQAQIDDPFNPPDWFPDQHPAMPPVVAQGQKPMVRACAQCHLPSGDGHPESASLAGLPVPYLQRQMTEFKNGRRKGVRATTMITIAQAISDADTLAASEYFSSLRPGVWTRVIETDTVAKSYIGAGGMRFAAPKGARSRSETASLCCRRTKLAQRAAIHAQGSSTTYRPAAWQREKRWSPLAQAARRFRAASAMGKLYEASATCLPLRVALRPMSCASSTT